ncbi:hypothetical protein PMNALOAF_2701 [Methylobacterium adhaesivum]|uniref:Phosphohydrolase n=1 Tax=Methylobacterium adhaesivum TaxID=333297 RepID=A0ABT8BKI6_9HYPH|nr:hypothetical protein [Methylobacterium adhaesivum]MDN3592055.1 hypothetical protein [Methylobacterium adhaesivum]GJD31442.1 hypothetical protein PMNALOAF_2701 [Methylobacterium adhaesivum]
MQATLTQFETYGGALVDLIEPRVEDISFDDIAISLSRIARFNGHSRAPYTVAQHSCIVANFLPEEHRVHGLLHDAPEYATGDLTSPLKLALSLICPEFRAAFKRIEGAFRVAIYQAAGIALPTPEVEAMVRRADLIALATEQREIMLSPNAWNLPLPASPRRIIPVDQKAAFLMYADALADCGILLGAPRARAA